MTDYLEGTQEQENALLEQAKRLERALSAWMVRGNGENAEHAPLQLERRLEGWKGAKEADWGGAEEVLSSMMEQRETSLAQAQEQQQRRKQELPLLSQLRQMEEAWDRMEEPGERGRKEPASQRAGRAPGWNPADLSGVGGLSPAAALLPGTQRESYSVSGQRQALASSGELTWAEQADRAFRRDSRRYDSGFYLY